MLAAPSCILPYRAFANGQERILATYALTTSLARWQASGAPFPLHAVSSAGGYLDGTLQAPHRDYTVTRVDCTIWPDCQADPAGQSLRAPTNPP
jgi:hypothetical protein